MPARFSRSVRPWVYRYLTCRDGEKCSICGRMTVSKPKKGTVINGYQYLDIDHIDGNKKNNDYNNLRLLCRSCNVKEEHRVKRAKVRGRVCVCKSDRTAEIRAMVPSAEGGIELQINALTEPRFRAWIAEMIEANGFVIKTDAIDGGAEIAGCSTATVQRYLRKLTSIAGELMETRDATGKAVIVPRKPTDKPGE